MHAKLRQKTIKDKSMQEVIQKMLSGDKTAPDVAFNRIIEYRMHLNHVIDAFKYIATLLPPEQSLSQHIQHLDDVEQTIYDEPTCKAFCNVLSFEVVPKEQYDNLVKKYMVIKQHDFIKECAAIAKRLIELKVDLKRCDPQAYLNDHDQLPNTPLAPYSMKLDLTALAMETDPSAFKQACNILNDMMSHTKAITNLYLSPDINLDEFLVAVQETLKKAAKMIPGCQRAFKELTKSMFTLRDNFSDYYKAFATTKQPSIFLEKYIDDVKNTASSDPTLKTQFMKIIEFFRGHMAGKVKDPKIAHMLDLAVESMNAFDGEGSSPMDVLNGAVIPFGLPAPDDVSQQESEALTKAAQFVTREEEKH